MNKIEKYLLIALGIIALLIAVFMAGRYSTPTKVITKTVTETKTVTQIQYQDKIVDHIVYVKVKEQKKDTHTVVTTDKKPNGEVVTTTVVDNHVDTKTNTNQTTTNTNQINKTTNQTVDSKSSTVTIKENGLPNWNLALMAGIDTSRIDLKQPISNLPLRVGGSLDCRIFGTLSIGAYGTVGTTASSLAPELGLRLALGL